MDIVVSKLATISQQIPPFREDNIVPETANLAIFATYKTNEEAIEDVCHYIINNLSDIIQLPELFFIADKDITNNPQQLRKIGEISKQLINQISAELRPFQYVCTSLVIEEMHQAVIISEHGLVATQQQLCFCQRYRWTELGNVLTIIELPLEQGTINVAMLTADDVNTPELIKTAVLENIHLLLVPCDIQEPYTVEYSLLSHAGEHRICIAAASREKSFVNNLSVDDSTSQNKNKRKIKPQKSTGFIIDLPPYPSLIKHNIQKIEGVNHSLTNQLIVKHQQGKITKALVHPIAACRKNSPKKD